MAAQGSELQPSRERARDKRKTLRRLLEREIDEEEVFLGIDEHGLAIRICCTCMRPGR